MGGGENQMEDEPTRGGLRMEKKKTVKGDEERKDNWLAVKYISFVIL